MDDITADTRWRVIMTDSYNLSGIAPVCPHQDDHTKHSTGAGYMQPPADVTGTYDCCPEPQIEVGLPQWAEQLRDLLNGAPGLSFALVSATNRARCERWHPDFPNDGWTGADWATAMGGEAGEALNVVKKLRRDDFGKVQAAADTRAGLLAQLATEIGDTFIYLDLLAQFYGLDLARCVADTFNRVSDREGFPERLPTAQE